MRVPWNMYNHTYAPSIEKALTSHRRGGIFGDRGVVDFWSRLMSHQAASASQGGGNRLADQIREHPWLLPAMGGLPIGLPGMIHPAARLLFANKMNNRTRAMTPAMFYRKLFEGIDPAVRKAFEQLMAYTPFGLDAQGLEAMHGKRVEQTVIGASDIARQARAAYGSGGGSIARAVRNRGLGLAESEYSSQLNSAAQDAQMRMLQIAQIMLQFINPALLAQYQAKKAMVDVQRDQVNRQFWQGIGQGIMMGGAM